MSGFRISMQAAVVCEVIFLWFICERFLFSYVAGLGLVTPLGTGVQSSWENLIGLKTGVRALSAEDLKLKVSSLLQQIPSRVAALVPRGSSPGEFDATKWQVSLLSSHFWSVV